ncbi:MAG: hypothetical protein AB7F70_00700 [Candidatus Omnitrophota bacterium]
MAALNAPDLIKFTGRMGFEYHGGKILESRTIIHRKFDEILRELNRNPQGGPQRNKALREYIYACEQIQPFDEPWKGYCKKNLRMLKHSGCIRKVRLDQMSDTDLESFMEDRFRMTLLFHGDFNQATRRRIQEIYHVYQLSRYGAMMTEEAGARERYRRNYILMKEVYIKEKDLFKKYQNRTITVDEYKNQVIDFKIAAMKKTEDWAEGRWKAYVVPDHK